MKTKYCVRRKSIVCMALISIACLLCAFCFGLRFDRKTAFAAVEEPTTAVFEFTGASISTTDNVGIRFGIIINKKAFTDNGGTESNGLSIVMELDKTNNPDEGEARSYTAEVSLADFTEANGYQVQINHRLMYGKLQEDQMLAAGKTSLTAECYIDGATKVPASNTVTRDMRSIAALHAANKPEELTKVNKFFGNSTFSKIAGYGYSDDDTVSARDVLEGSYTAYLNASKQESAVTVAADKIASLTVVDETLVAGENKQLVLFNEADDSVCVYPIEVYADYVEVTQSNHSTVLKAGYTQPTHMVLTEDITMSGYWQVAEANTFNGLFDGQNHTIDGLSMSAQGGVFYSITGKVQNVSATNVNLSGSGNVATFAYIQGNGDVTFENVYVVVKQVHSRGRNGGLIDRNANAEYKMIVKDCYVELPTSGRTDVAYCGYISGHDNKNYELQGSNVFVGGFNLLYASVAYTDTYATAADADKAYKTEALELSSWLANKFDDTFYTIGQSNYTDLNDASKIGGKYVYLTEPVDMSASTAWVSTVVFNGTFDGQGYTVSKFDAGAGSGLFNTLTGATIKNVAFVNARVGDHGQKSAVIAYNIATGVVSMIENVFISASFGEQAYTGTICNLPSTATPQHLQLTNCVIEVIDNTTEFLDRKGFVGGWRMPLTKLTNCYFISDNCSTLYGSNATCSGTLDNSSTYTTYGTASEKTARQNFLDANTAGTVTGLSEQMNTWITTYITVA